MILWPCLVLEIERRWRREFKYWCTGLTAMWYISSTLVISPNSTPRVLQMRYTLTVIIYFPRDITVCYSWEKSFQTLEMILNVITLFVGGREEEIECSWE